MMSIRYYHFLIILTGLVSPSIGQDSPAPTNSTSAVIVPQGSFSQYRSDQANVTAGRVNPLPISPDGGGKLGAIEIPKVSAEVKIHNDVAETGLRFQCLNPSKQTKQAQLAVPLPKNSEVIRTPQQYAMKGAPQPRDQTTLWTAPNALVEWQKLAKQLAHPGPVEFCGWPLLKTNPVELSAGQSQPVDIKYAQPLAKNSKRCDYVLPRSESVEYAVPWTIQVDVQSDQPISTVYSPSHKLKANRVSEKRFDVTVDAKDAAQPGAFWLSYLTDQGGISATLFTQPDDATPENDGTFLFLAGLPTNLSENQAIPRELTLALDRSGSMQGQKIEQVREAAVQILKSLNQDETFNIISYNDAVQSFAKDPVQNTPQNLEAAKTFIADVRPRGGTNLHGALLEAVRQKPTPHTLPIVLFFTDGLPTVGETAEGKIQGVIAKQNPYHRRVFTVGVGVDVNTPLLESIATETRAKPTFVLPAENIKTKVSQVFESLQRPILADAKLSIQSEDEKDTTPRVSDVFPAPLPDLFKGDHLVVLGRYQGDDPLKFRLTGNYLGTERTFEFTFPVKDQPVSPFVARLWATRKIADLVQEIRKSGANADPYVILTNPKQDPKLKSLSEEILQLTTKHGILTEYTAFLAKRGNRQNEREQLNEAYRNFDERAVKTRVGLSSVNQSINNNTLQTLPYLNGVNYYYDSKMKRVNVPNVQQLFNGAFFLRGTTWVDGRLVTQPNVAPKKVIEFGSPEYEKLVKRLSANGEHTPLSLRGNVLIEIDKVPVLVVSPPNLGNPAASSRVNASER